MEAILKVYGWCVASPKALKVPANRVKDFDYSRAPFVLAAERLYGDNLPIEWKKAANELRGMADDATVEEVKAQMSLSWAPQ